ncbi:MAG: TIR domain-containing protein [Vicinamibacterales bacterium]
MNDPVPVPIEAVHLDLFGMAFPPFTTGTRQFVVVGPHVVTFEPDVREWQREMLVTQLMAGRRAAADAGAAGPDAWSAAYATELGTVGLMTPGPWLPWPASHSVLSTLPMNDLIAWAFGDDTAEAWSAASALALLRVRRDDREFMEALGEGIQARTARLLVSVVSPADRGVAFATLLVNVDGPATLGALLDGRLPSASVRVARQRVEADLDRASSAMPPDRLAGPGLSPAPSGASPDDVFAGGSDAPAMAVELDDVFEMGGDGEMSRVRGEHSEPSHGGLVMSPAPMVPPAPGVSAAASDVKAALEAAPGRGSGPTPPGTERVDAAVYGPREIAPASVFLVQVFLYPVGAEATVATQARQVDEAADLRGSRSLDLTLAPGTRVDIRLDIPGLAVDEPDAYLVWRQDIASIQFEVAVPGVVAQASVIARVRFAINGVPAGTLRFTLKVVPHGSASASPEVREVQAARYRRAFVSYSSKDRAEVLKRVQAFKIAGMSVFQDVLDLDPGERWERALYREIDTCDVFLLFWSSSAAGSTWVLKEIDYALQRKGGDEDRPPAIQPVPIEGPPIPTPPAGLGGLHFNDALLAHIAAAAARPPATTG